jgi:hypothetical protein
MKYKLSANLSGKLDKQKGVIRDVSIISEGPALGHGLEVDTKTLSGIFELEKGQVLKAYWTHGGMFSGDRLGEEVGLFSAFHLSGNKLLAHFQVLEAFRKTYPARFDYLFELADKAKDNFGVSISFEGEAVWLLDSGAEVSADGDRPANAVGDVPRVRVSRLLSADFVSEPAANAGGLFSQGKLTELLDLKQKLSADLTDLVSKLTASDEKNKATETERATLSAKLDEANKALEAERKNGEAKATEFAAQKAALDATVTELAAKVAALTTASETQKTEAATKQAEFDAQIAAMNRTLLSFGAVPVNIYTEAVDYRATFAAIKDPAEKTAFWRKHKALLMAQG